MLENRRTSVQQFHYTRYIVAWINAGGYEKFGFGDKFKEWLELNVVTKHEIREILEMLEISSTELEETVTTFMKNH